MLCHLPTWALLRQLVVVRTVTHTRNRCTSCIPNALMVPVGPRTLVELQSRVVPELVITRPRPFHPPLH